MGRRKLVEGQRCRYGHAWNRTPDGKRCLDCYPPRLLFDELSAEEQAARRVVGAVRRARHLTARAEASRKRQEIQSRHEGRLNSRKRNTYRQKDPAQRSYYHLFQHAAAGAPIATLTELRALLLQQRGLCAMTGLPLGDKPHLDHKIPIAKGGAHTIDNLQWVHPRANLAKRDSTDEEFRAWLLAAAEALKKKIELENLL